MMYVLDDGLFDGRRLIVTTTTLDTFHNDFSRQTMIFDDVTLSTPLSSPILGTVISLILGPTILISEIRRQLLSFYEFTGLTHFSGYDFPYFLNAFSELYKRDLP